MLLQIPLKFWQMCKYSLVIISGTQKLELSVITHIEVDMAPGMVCKLFKLVENIPKTFSMNAHLFAPVFFYTIFKTSPW